MLLFSYSHRKISVILVTSGIFLSVMQSWKTFLMSLAKKRGALKGKAQEIKLVTEKQWLKH